MASNMAYPADPMGEFVRPVEQIERCEIVGAADIVFPALARPKQNATVVAHRRLRDLHVEMIAVEGNFTGHGDAGLIGAEVVGTGIETQRCRNTAELRFRTAVEEALGLRIIGDGLSKIELLGCPGHVGDSESERTIPAARSRRAPGSPEVPALLS